MLSMKFPHLFLRPEIIITFLWGWEWSGGQVRHRSPRNSGYYEAKTKVNVFLQEQRQITLLHQFLLPFAAGGGTLSDSNS